jgi:uncharacterized glyoxalase superfamily protein PhnB
MNVPFFIETSWNFQCCGAMKMEPADFDVDGHKLVIFSREPMAEAIDAEKPEPKTEGQDFVCLVFAVADVDSNYESLRDKGVELLNQPHDRKDWGIRCFHLRDPDGDLIEVNRDFGIDG